MVPDPAKYLNVVEEPAPAAAFELTFISDLTSPGVVVQVVGVQLLLQLAQGKAENVLVLGLEVSSKKEPSGQIISRHSFISCHGNTFLS